MIPKFFLSPSGSDANTGMSAASPWRHHPGSRKATGLSAAFGAIWKALGLMVLLLVCVQAQATIAVVHRYNLTTIGTITSTTSGNNFVAITDCPSLPSALAFGGGGSFTKLFDFPVTAISHMSVWYITNIAGSKTSVSATGCGTANAWHGWEISGSDNTKLIVDIAGCYAFGAVCNSPANTLQFYPGFSTELVLYGGNCTGSATSMSASGITLTSAFPGGEPGADGIVSSTSKLTIAPDSGCGGNGGIILGIKDASASLSQCQANIALFDYGAEKAANSPTVAALLLKTGDIVTMSGWAITTATPTSMTVGTDTATQLVAGSSDASDGQPWIYADLNSAVKGSQTITFTTTGSPSETQVSYREWVPTATCTASLDVTAGPANGTGTAVNTPSITPSAGDLVLNFTPVQSHTTAVNSPWLCDEYGGSGETASCYFVGTVNAFPYIQGAASSSTANNLTQLSSNTWQGVMAAIKLTPPGGGGTTIIPALPLLGVGVGEKAAEPIE